MKWPPLIILTLIIFFMTSCLSEAQNKNPLPLLGSIQDLVKSDFCKKYKCQAVYDKQLGVLTHYILTVSGQNPAFFQRLGRTLLLPKRDPKKRLIYAEIRLQEDFKTNLGISNTESELIADFLYFSIGKKLLLTRDAFNNNYSPDINNCFSDVRFSPKENNAFGARVMFTGFVTLEGEGTKVKYQAACTSLTSARSKSMYIPSFSLEVLGSQ